MSVCCECCVLSGGVLCVGLISGPEDSYRVWCALSVIEVPHRGGLDSLGMSSHENMTTLGADTLWVGLLSFISKSFDFLIII